MRLKAVASRPNSSLRPHVDVRRQVAAGDPFDAPGQDSEVACHPVRQRDDADECQRDERQAETEVACRGAPAARPSTRRSAGRCRRRHPKALRASRSPTRGRSIGRCAARGRVSPGQGRQPLLARRCRPCASCPSASTANGISPWSRRVIIETLRSIRSRLTRAWTVPTCCPSSITPEIEITPSRLCRALDGVGPALGRGLRLALQGAGLAPERLRRLDDRGLHVQVDTRGVGTRGRLRHFDGHHVPVSHGLDVHLGALAVRRRPRPRRPRPGGGGGGADRPGPAAPSGGGGIGGGPGSPGISSSFSTSPAKLPRVRVTSSGGGAWIWPGSARHRAFRPGHPPDPTDTALDVARHDLHAVAQFLGHEIRLDLGRTAKGVPRGDVGVGRDGRQRARPTSAGTRG